MPLEIRKPVILEMLAEKTFVQTQELADKLGVSTLTARRDLDALHST